MPCDFDDHDRRRHPGFDPHGDGFNSGEDFALGSFAAVPAMATNGPARGGAKKYR
jgi:hypothetical protein